MSNQPCKHRKLYNLKYNPWKEKDPPLFLFYCIYCGKIFVKQIIIEKGKYAYNVRVQRTMIEPEDEVKFNEICRAYEKEEAK